MDEWNLIFVYSYYFQIIKLEYNLWMNGSSSEVEENGNPDSSPISLQV